MHPPADPPAPAPPGEAAPDATEDDAQAPPESMVGDEPRLTAEELAFLLRDPADQARRAERAERSNRARTERRHDDPAYAERLRLADRERQRRRRLREAIGRPETPETPAVPLPALTVEQAASRLRAALARDDSPQAAQLRRQPDRIRAYAEAFAAYRALAIDGSRPTRGALAALLRSRFGRDLTPSQIQKLRDHVEGFAAPGGPWAPAPLATRKADTVGHAPPPGSPPLAPDGMVKGR